MGVELEVGRFRPRLEVERDVEAYEARRVHRRRVEERAAALVTGRRRVVVRVGGRIRGGVVGVEQVLNEDKGLFGGKDFMILKLGSGAPYAEIKAEVKGGIDSKTWAQQVKRAVDGVIAQESNVVPDPELMERLKNAPTACPNCGGVLPKLMSGQTEATCKYCGSVMRI